MGPSGCGKTTLLRLIAGLEALSDENPGTLKWQSGSRPFRTGVVFQEPRLLPWRKVGQNLQLAVQALHPNERLLARQGIPEVLEALGIAHTSNLLPAELSGGMRQRVAIARALLFGNELQLWDEPLQNLDDSLRLSILSFVRSIWKKAGTSAIVVTHDPEEARLLGDRLIRLS